MPTDDWEQAVAEAVEWTLQRLAEGLRDQAAMAAERGDDALAKLLRATADEVEERKL